MPDAVDRFLSGVKERLREAREAGRDVRVELHDESGKNVEKVLSASEALKLDLTRVFGVREVGEEKETPERKESPENPVVAAMIARHALDISYVKADGKAISRRVDPYEVKNGFLWCANHGTSEIKSLKLSRLVSARMTDRAVYKPVWPVRV